MGRFYTNVINAERLAQRLRDQPYQITEALIPVITRAGESVANRAIEGINNGPKTGRIYTHRFYTDAQGRVRPLPNVTRPPHQASAQGEYPAADTGILAGSIFYDQEEDVRFSAESLDEIISNVFAEAEYAAPLEFKPEGRGGRPFLRRAAGELADQILAEIIAAIRGSIGPDGGGTGGGGGPSSPGPSPAPFTPRPPRSPPPAPSSNEGLPGFSADELNRAQLDLLRNPPQLPSPDDGEP